jgi:hypothetical protein
MQRIKLGLTCIMIAFVLFAACLLHGRADSNLSSPARVQSDATGATAAAVPTRAEYAGAISSGNLAGIIQCDKSVVFNSTTAATTQLVALSGTQVIYVCGYSLMIQGVATTPASIKFVQGTGSNCATSPTDLTGTLTGSTVAGSPLEMSVGGGLGSIFRTTAGQALCMTTVTTTLKAGTVFYTQF